jgi:hypothetical protein
MIIDSDETESGSSDADIVALHALCEEKAVFAATLGANAVICGVWVWADFTDKPASETREKLKSEGFKWASQKGKWYFAGKPRANRRPMSYDFITAKYGEEEVRGYGSSRRA